MQQLGELRKRTCEAFLSVLLKKKLLHNISKFSKESTEWGTGRERLKQALVKVLRRRNWLKLKRISVVFRHARLATSQTIKKHKNKNKKIKIIKSYNDWNGATYCERLVDSLWQLSPNRCDPDARYDHSRRGWARSPCSGHARSCRMLVPAGSKVTPSRFMGHVVEYNISRLLVATWQ